MSSTYIAKILGDICPDAEIDLDYEWSGEGDEPYIKIIDHVVVVVIDDDFSVEGTITIDGTIGCNGESIAVGPITLNISEGGDSEH